MSDKPLTENGLDAEPADDERPGRRGFLIGLGRWSKIVIGAAVFGGLALSQSQAEAGWFNRRGGWVNRHGGGRGSWINRHGGGGGGWVNRHGGGGWANRNGGGGWANRNGGGGWANRNGGGGGSWINRR